MQNLDTEELVIDKEIAWSNQNNNDFYEAIKAEGLRELAEKGGLTTNCDIEALTSYWSNAQSVLEVGAGYGRIISYLLKHQFQGKITAIERCCALFKHLRNEFEQQTNVHLLNADIRHLCNSDIDERFDVIFFLWGGICDFSPIEQSLIIKKLAKLLQKKGTLIIDTIPTNYTPLGSKKYKQNFYSIEIKNTILHVHLPDKREMENNAKAAGLSKIDYIKLTTDIGRERILYTLC